MARSAFALDVAAARSGARTPLWGELGAGEQQPQGNAAACEELLAEMWRRRSAVEHALRVASELYAEAEAAAMQAYAHTQQKAGSAHNAWWKDQGRQGRPTLTAAQREEVRVSRPACASWLISLTGRHLRQVIARLLSERAALAEADLLVYARHAAAWSEFIALNPLVAAAAAQLAQQDRVRRLVPLVQWSTAEAACPRLFCRRRAAVQASKRPQHHPTPQPRKPSVTAGATFTARLCGRSLHVARRRKRTRRKGPLAARKSWRACARSCCARGAAASS